MNGTRKLALTILMAMLMLLPVALLGQSATGGDAAPAEEVSSPTRGWLDIEIEDIQKVQVSASNNYYPGQTLGIDVNLVHGYRPYLSETSITPANSFTVVLIIDDGKDNVTSQYRVITSMSHLIYTAGQGGVSSVPLSVRFTWEVPLKKPEGWDTWSNNQFKMSATITVDDDDKSDNFRTGAGIRVSDPEFAPGILEGDQVEGGKDILNGPIHFVTIGQYINIPFRLHNFGNNIDRIGIRYLSIPEGWKPEGFSEEGFDVYPNDFLELELALFISPRNTLSKHDSEAPFDYMIEVETYSLFYPDGATNGGYQNDPDHRHNFRFSVRPTPNVWIEPQSYQHYFEPMENREYEVKFDLTNTGNYENQFHLEAPLDLTDISNGWSAKAFPAMTEPIEPGETMVVYVKVRVPPDAPHYYNVNIFLRARSGVEPIRDLGDGLACQVLASTRFAGRIEDKGNAPFQVAPGREYKIYFNFTNMGNNKDPDQYLKVGYQPLGWSVYIDQTNLRIGSGIGPKTTVNLPLTVFIPETTTAKSYFIQILAYGAVNNRILDSVKYNFKVEERHKVGLTASEFTKVGFIGGQIEFLLGVKNRGSWLDTFNLSVDSDWAELEQEQVKVAPNDTYPVRMWVTIPQDAAADTYPDTSRPDQDGLYDGYTIKVWAYSQNETRDENTLISMDLIIKVNPYYDFEIKLSEGMEDLRFSIDDMETKTIRLDVVNLGNIQDEIKLEWVDNQYQSALRLQNSNVNIDFQGTTTAFVSLDLERMAPMEVGKYEVELRGISTRSREFGDVTKEIVYELELEFYELLFDIETVRINDIEVEEGGLFPGEKDKRYSFQVDISNYGSVDLDPTLFPQLYVVLYDGPFEFDRANITYLQKNNQTTVYLAWTASTRGKHTMTIKLEGELPLSEQSIDAKPVTFDIPPPPEVPPPPKPIDLVDVLLPIIALLIFCLLIFVFLYRFNQIEISAIDTGYDESGEYRPWAVREKLMDETKEELPGAEDKNALPPTDRPELPPAPAAAVAPPMAPPAPVARPGPMAPAQPMPVPQAQRPPMAQLAQARPAAPQMRPPVQGQQPMRPPVPQAAPVQPRPRPPVPQQPVPRPPVPQAPPRPPVQQPAARPPAPPAAPAQVPPRPPVQPPAAPQAPARVPPKPPVAP
ncbi:MAG: hypothetical protein KAH57_00060 [Thermoplasmata archaeon]|nr:hypothetical protein [Thermoplasmata archaeon]